MSDIATLEKQIGGAIASASDESALESVRVAALGKSGSVSALLKTLGAMTPDERKQQGPLINGLKDRVTAAITARREALKNAAPDVLRHRLVISFEAEAEDLRPESLVKQVLDRLPVP